MNRPAVSLGPTVAEDMEALPAGLREGWTGSSAAELGLLDSVAENAARCGLPGAAVETCEALAARAHPHPHLDTRVTAPTSTHGQRPHTVAGLADDEQLSQVAGHLYLKMYGAAGGR